MIPFQYSPFISRLPELAQTYTAFPDEQKGYWSRAKRRQTTQPLASAVRHVWQPSHGGALVIRRKMRVLARNSRALVPYNLARDKI
jgi:hypothetical protein